MHAPTCYGATMSNSPTQPTETTTVDRQVAQLGLIIARQRRTIAGLLRAGVKPVTLLTLDRLETRLAALRVGQPGGLIETAIRRLGSLRRFTWSPDYA